MLILHSSLPVRYPTPCDSQNTLSGIWLWLTAFVDCALTFALYALLTRRFEGRLLSSIRHVISVAVRTSLQTSILSVVAAILAVAWPQEHTMTANISLAFELPLSSLLALTVLVTLGSRTPKTATVSGLTMANGVPAEGEEKSTLALALARFKPQVEERAAEVDLESGREEEDNDWEDEGDMDRARAKRVEPRAAEMGLVLPPPMLKRVTSEGRFEVESDGESDGEKLQETGRKRSGSVRSVSFA